MIRLPSGPRFALRAAALLLVFGPPFGLPPDVRAATYHVAVGGSDAAPGTVAQPWATLQWAVDTVVPGDVILIEPGTFAGCRIERSGAPGAPCTLAAATAGTVLINAAGPRNRHQSHVEAELFGTTITHWIIDGLEVSGSLRYGIDMRDTSDITVQRCNVHGSRVTGIFDGFADRATYVDNESWNNGEHGIYHSNSGDDFVIARNRLHHNAAAGVHMNGDASQGGDGLLSRGLVERNVIWENGLSGGSAINCDGVTDSIIRNNLVYDNHASGIALFGIDGAEGSRDNLVAHNTIVQRNDGRSRWVINMVDFGGPSPPIRNRIVGNILYTERLARGSLAIWDPAAQGFVSEDNIVVNRFSADNDTSIITLAEWQATGHDLRSVVATAAELFVDEAAGDYRLRPGSPAIDLVPPQGEVTEDLDGVGRPSGAASDAGCYEVSAGCPDPAPGVVTGLRVDADLRTLTWDALAGADTYDVIAGDIAVMRTSGLTTAVQRCVVNDVAAAQADDPLPLGPGEARLYLVRGSSCGGAGTWDSGGASQRGSRDAPIGASANTCL